MFSIESRRGKKAEDYRNENSANDMRKKILKDKSNNQRIREMTDVERLEASLREQRLRWLEHVEKID